MSSPSLEQARRWIPFVFVTLVTALLLAFVCGQVSRGLEGAPGMLVYAFASGFGLEFVSASWSGRSRGTGRARQLPS